MTHSSGVVACPEKSAGFSNSARAVMTPNDANAVSGRVDVSITCASAARDLGDALSVLERIDVAVCDDGNGDAVGDRPDRLEIRRCATPLLDQATVHGDPRKARVLGILRQLDGLLEVLVDPNLAAR